MAVEADGDTFPDKARRADAQLLEEAFDITSVADLGKNTYVRAGHLLSQVAT